MGDSSSASAPQGLWMKRKWRHDHIGSARRATSLSLPQPAAEADASDSSAAAGPFLPGDEVTAAADHHRYRLESIIRSGPRSTVWKAATLEDGRPVAIKVLKSGSREQQASALQELSIMQQITHSHRSKHHAKQAAAAAAGAGGISHQQASHAAASGSSGPSSGTTHLVQLLDSLQVSQHSLAALQQQQQQQQDAALPVAAHQQQQQRVVEAFRVHPALSGCGTAAEPAGGGTLAAPPAAVAASTAAAAAADEGCGAVLLVLEPLHQSLSWVLHFLRQRAGRLGLPSFAVRRLAHQLLTGLAELHDASAVVHRDIKPSNLLLQTPYVMRKDEQLMRSMTLAELAAAQWSVIDLGSAARLLPPTAEAAAAAAASSPAPAAAAARSSQGGLLGGLAAWLASVTGGSSGGGAGGVAADSPSSMRWQVAAGALVPYETPAYTPPEALLQLPATAAYDIWSAACVIYEAATGRLLFPLEAAASASGLKLPRGVRPSGDLMRLVKTAAAAGNPVAAEAAAAASGGSEAAEDEPSSEEVEFMLDQLHLILMRNVAGPPTPLLLAASAVADDLFSNKVTGTTWLEHDEADGGLGLWGLGTRTRRTAPQRRSLLHQLMASRSMSLDEAVALTDLLTPMLSWDPADRPTAAQLLMHPYFKPLAEGRDVPQQQQQAVAAAAGAAEEKGRGQ